MRWKNLKTSILPSWWICSMSGRGKWWGQHPWRGGHQTPRRQHPTRTSHQCFCIALNWIDFICSILVWTRIICAQSWWMFVLWPTCLAALLKEAMVFSLIRWCLESARQKVSGDMVPNVLRLQLFITHFAVCELPAPLWPTSIALLFFQCFTKQELMSHWSPWMGRITR